jgi:hypothetical protein
VKFGGLSTSPTCQLTIHRDTISITQVETKLTPGNIRLNMRTSIRHNTLPKLINGGSYISIARVVAQHLHARRILLNQHDGTILEEDPSFFRRASFSSGMEVPVLSHKSLVSLGGTVQSGLG